jgi:hypothetical protein
MVYDFSNLKLKRSI